MRRVRFRVKLFKFWVLGSVVDELIIFEEGFEPIDSAWPELVWSTRLSYSEKSVTCNGGPGIDLTFEPRRLSIKIKSILQKSTSTYIRAAVEGQHTPKPGLVLPKYRHISNTS